MELWWPWSAGKTQKRTTHVATWLGAGHCECESDSAGYLNQPLRYQPLGNLIGCPWRSSLLLRPGQLQVASRGRCSLHPGRRPHPSVTNLSSDYQCGKTKPSRPMRQAARNRSGPISPRSNGATVMPSGRRARSCSRLDLRRCRGSDRRSSPPITSRRKSAPHDRACSGAHRYVVMKWLATAAAPKQRMPSANANSNAILNSPGLPVIAFVLKNGNRPAGHER
jgi:hypothetical protein